MPKKTGAYRVALIFSPHIDYELRMFAGVRHWRNWPGTVQFRQFVPGPGREPWPELDAWQPDGVIGHVADRVTIRHLEQRGHLVRLAPSADGLRPAHVGLDHDALARMALEHLCTVGYTNLACVGWRTHFTSAVHRAATAAGRTLHPFTLDPRAPGADTRSGAMVLLEQFRRWVGRLPTPVGILCEFDVDAVRLADVCMEAGRGIPQEVGILGGGDTAHACELNQPALSCPELPGEAIGLAAAERMSALLAGREPPAPVSIPPPGMTERASTARIDHPDPAIRAAIEALRAGALQGTTVAEVLRGTGISRRRFEMAAKQVLGHTPAVELRRLRLREAEKLLRATRLTVQEIAARCGYGSATHFHYVFRRARHQTPEKFRRNTPYPEAFR